MGQPGGTASPTVYGDRLGSALEDWTRCLCKGPRDAPFLPYSWRPLRGSCEWGWQRTLASLGSQVQTRAHSVAFGRGWLFQHLLSVSEGRRPKFDLAFDGPGIHRLYPGHARQGPGDRVGVETSHCSVEPGLERGLGKEVGAQGQQQALCLRLQVLSRGWRTFLRGLKTTSKTDAPPPAPRVLPGISY